MDESRRAIARLLRQLAEELCALSDIDYRDLLDGKLRLALLHKNTANPSKKRRGAVHADEHAFAEIAAELQRLSDREAGVSLLHQRCSTKVSLERLARCLDLPVRREDTAENLRDRIIEATIGFRLRSQAIRGKAPETP
jgi:hypothetical protein